MRKLLSLFIVFVSFNVYGFSFESFYSTESLVIKESTKCAYRFVLNLDIREQPICVDALKIKQINESTYQVSFVNYIPGTKIPFHKINLHFDGTKELIESEILTLNDLLVKESVADLYFDTESKFYLQIRSDADKASVKMAEYLVEFINQRIL